MRSIDFKRVLKKELTPPYKPPEDHLNCDPSLELEEMIVETKPLHKKKKRLAKQRSAQKDTTTADTTSENNNFIKEFIVYNRFKELKRKAMELKEKEWQEELNALMASSQVNNLSSIREVSNEHTGTVTKSISKITSTVTTTVVRNIGERLSQAIASTSPSQPNFEATTSTHFESTIKKTKSTTKKEGETIDYIDSMPSFNKGA